MTSETTSWMHIGLHGHSVGKFSAEPGGIRWKSAMDTNDDDVILTKSIPSSSISGAQWTVFSRSGHLRIQIQPPDGSTNSKLPSEMRFDGFPASDYDKVKTTLSNLYSIDVSKFSVCPSGESYGLTHISSKTKHLTFQQCLLEDADEEGEEFEPREGDEMCSMNLAEVSQCVLQGNTRNEIELQFHESDTVEAGTDQLVAVRFYVPPDPEADPTDKEAPTAAEHLQKKISKIANIKNTAGNEIVQFYESTFLTPRGRYQITLFDSFLRMYGNRYDYKIKYDDISRLFLLPKPDDVHMAFVIALDKPIRQGQQRYQMLVLQTTKETEEIKINLDEAILEKEYNGDLQPVMQGSLCNLIAKTFKIIAKKKVFIPGKFLNAYKQPCVKCAVRANEGHLYPLEKSFVFIHKPPVLIRFDEVESVEFQRYAGGQGSTRNFDLCVTLDKRAGDKEYVFSGIDRSDYQNLYSFLSGKKIKIKNIQEFQEASNPTGMVDYNEVDMGGEDSSEDEDFGSDDGESSSGGEDSDDDDLVADDDVDSDLEEAREKASTSSGGKKKSSASKKKARSDSEVSDSDEEDEETAPPKKKKSKKAVKSADDGKKKKKKKDPNAPKKALSSYMFFVKDMRAQVKEEQPELSFGEVGKILGQKWKEADDDVKAKYNAMAAKDKERYKEEMEDYVPPPEYA